MTDVRAREVRDFMTIFVGRMSNNMIMDPRKETEETSHLSLVEFWCGLWIDKKKLRGDVHVEEKRVVDHTDRSRNPKMLVYDVDEVLLEGDNGVVNSYNSVRVTNRDSQRAEIQNQDKPLQNHF